MSCMTVESCWHGKQVQLATCECMQETQTKPEGQIHFFPVLFKGNQLYDVMAERCGSSQNSAPAENSVPAEE